MSEPNLGPPTRRSRIAVGRYSIPVPASRLARMALGVALVLLGFVGFLPVIGFWMIPLGLVVLSVDLAPVRRFRRRVELWWGRRRKDKNKA